MALIEGLLCGMTLFFYIESLRQCFYFNRHPHNQDEIIPIIIHHSSSTGEFVVRHEQENFNIERCAPLTNEETNDNCSICFEKMNTIRYIRKTICGHMFCSECIQEWLHKKKSCPLCNREF